MRHSRCAVCVLPSPPGSDYEGGWHSARRESRYSDPWGNGVFSAIRRARTSDLFCRDRTQRLHGDFHATDCRAVHPIAPAWKRSMARFQLLVGLMLISVGVSACSDSFPEPDPAAVQRGRQLSVNCTSCHSLKGHFHGIGPVLTGIVGRKAGSMEGYGYSPAMKARNIVWTPDTLASFIKNPSEYVPGTKMALAPISEQDARDIASYLQTATR